MEITSVMVFARSLKRNIRLSYRAVYFCSLGVVLALPAPSSSPLSCQVDYG
jgi:hypothetical protein